MTRNGKAIQWGKKMSPTWKMILQHQVVIQLSSMTGHGEPTMMTLALIWRTTSLCLAEIQAFWMILNGMKKLARRSGSCCCSSYMAIHAVSICFYEHRVRVLFCCEYDDISELALFQNQRCPEFRCILEYPGMHLRDLYRSS
mmetsp:Transcript_4873/g.11183  ORF Transcript_4873/g.11183 Transcript_4873/m.11183 type:complete len:142 (-) Transcript_4873:151-576(-)